MVHHLDVEELPKVYAHHEVAGHTYTHKHLEQLEENDIREQITRCQDGLAQLFGREIPGMAYPYGTYDDRVIRIAEEAGVRYARTCVQRPNMYRPMYCLQLILHHLLRRAFWQGVLFDNARGESMMTIFLVKIWNQALP